MTSHLEEGLLHELLDGEIPSAELPPIQAHLAGCAECRARLTEARGFQSVSDQLIEELDQPAAASRAPQAAPVLVHRSPWKRNLAWAATVVAAVGIGYYGGQDNRPAPLADARPTVSAPAAEAAAAPTDSAFPNPQAPAPAVATAPAAAPAQPTRQKVLADRPAEQDAAEEKKDMLGKTRASANESERLDQTRARRENQPPAPATLERRAAATSPAERSFADAAKARQGSLEVSTQSGLRAQGSLAGAAIAPERIEFSEAVRRLGGALRLIEGLVPDRLEALGQEVRVVYPLASGELLLRQHLIDGRITFRLTAPAGFPADSLERLKARVRE